MISAYFFICLFCINYTIEKIIILLKF